MRCEPLATEGFPAFEATWILLLRNHQDALDSDVDAPARRLQLAGMYLDQLRCRVRVRRPARRVLGRESCRRRFPVGSVPAAAGSALSSSLQSGGPGS